MTIRKDEIGAQITVTNGVTEIFGSEPFMSYAGTIIEKTMLAAAALTTKPGSLSVDAHEYTVRIDAWSTEEDVRTLKAVRTAQGFHLIS